MCVETTTATIRSYAWFHCFFVWLSRDRTTLWLHNAWFNRHNLVRVRERENDHFFLLSKDRRCHTHLPLDMYMSGVEWVEERRKRKDATGGDVASFSRSRTPTQTHALDRQHTSRAPIATRTNIERERETGTHSDVTFWRFIAGRFTSSGAPHASFECSFVCTSVCLLFLIDYDKCRALHVHINRSLAWRRIGKRASERASE